MSDKREALEALYDELRREIIEIVRGEPDRRAKRSPVSVAGHVGDLLSVRGIPRREQDQAQLMIFQIFHELYLEGIIVPGRADHTDQTSAMAWPSYRLTEYGRHVLQEREYSPYDPDGYLRRLMEEIPGVDETIIRYVEESLSCLRANCLLAAAVTMGCASEKAMLLLIEEFGDAISDAAKKGEYVDKTGKWMIKSKYDAFRKYLDSVAANLPKPLRDPLETKLHGIFEVMRRTRNEAGHPTGDPIDRAEIVANHTVFPGYCKYVYDLMAHFRRNGVSL
jgi:hypothetical protein